MVTDSSILASVLLLLQNVFILTKCVYTAVSDSGNISQSCVALVQHSGSNSKQVADLHSFNFGDILQLSSLGKFSSSVTKKS